MLQRARSWLETRGLERSRLDAELLVAHALGLKRLDLFLELERPLGEDEVTRARELLVRRSKGEPTAYLTGRREFYGRSFRVGPGVLIPRPETELLVDRAREIAAEQGWSAPRAVDVGTGSGCLAVTLALELAGSTVAGLDVSQEALTWARDNAGELGAEVTWIHSDGLAAWDETGFEAAELVLSNPPYVDPAGADELPIEVRDHEPKQALFAPPGEPDHWVARLLAEAVPRLAPGGALLVELGVDQGPRCLERARAAGLEARVHRDLAGIDRVLEIRA